MKTMGFGMRAVAILAFLLLMLVPLLPAVALAQDVGLPGPSSSTAARPAPPPDTDISGATAIPSTGGGASMPVVGTTDEHYRLGTGDKLRVVVYGEDDLSGEVSVDGSGQVQMPLVGQVQAAGLTIHEFIAEVTKSLENGYLKEPKVSVQVENFRPFYIMGEVNKPGEYPYENGLTVLGAVALAGGFTYRASDGEVYIRHTGSTKEVTVPADATERVAPGDIIRVAERIF